MFPYLDKNGFSRRAVFLSSDEISYVEEREPGFIVQQIALESSYVNGRFRKRYGNNGMSNSLPFGQAPPLLMAAGTTPSNVVLNGRPILGSLQIIIAITTGGALGTAVFKYSIDGGITYTTGVATGASVGLIGTGLVAGFAAGTYNTDNIYSAATPVPEVVLRWVTLLVSFNVRIKRGFNPQDPVNDEFLKLVREAKDEIKEAADSKDGLWDLPTSEDTDSAVTTGGPMGYSETSPYVWRDIERTVGRYQDKNRSGS